MNKKAEQFKNYLEERSINVFNIEEIKGDEQNTVAFRSMLQVEGQNLPLIVIVDDSIFTVIRVLIFANARNKNNELNLLKLAETENAAYKPFKIYCNDAGDLFIDVCLTFTGDFNGDAVYLILEALINYLNGAQGGYRKMIQTILS